MKPIAKNVALALSFFICLSFFPIINTAVTNPLLTETCQKVKNKDLCTSSLGAEHATQDAKDVAALALIAINVASNHGVNTSVYIKKQLLDGKILEPTTEQNFEDCSENYEDAMQELDDGLAGTLSRDFKQVKIELESAIDDADTCISVLNQKAGKDKELYEKTNHFRQLISNAYDIANILAPK
ncbi:hypothetical protein CXB51_031951 [Gossypium anomalum]|uniref:Pectinesterase inhibitor domain-containing protein n=1 Tax=Gossypium anomalum TaxID=47600 RepID=A0A8J5Y9A9_9ROSI|nr:hypothetical protein CXB51_031951 [Gossypium anomalum]